MRLLRVNMSNVTAMFEDMPEDWRRFGNRGLIAKVAMAEIPPACDPLGPDSKLIFAQSLLAGTAITTAGRMSIGGKSPLTYGIKEANVGGMPGKAISALNIRLIIVEGQPDPGASYVLLLDAEGNARLIRNDALRGMMNYHLVDTLRKQYGEKSELLVCGPAAEKGYRIACIMATDFATKEPCRAAGRGGLGALMGSKGLKAIVIQHATTPWKATPAAPDAYKAALADFHKKVSKHSSVQARARYGTFAGVRKNAETGILPVKNFRSMPINVDKIDAQAINDYLEQYGGRYGLPCQSGCMMKCSNYFVNRQGQHTASAYNYETLGMAGSNLLLDDLAVMSEIKRLCDEYGVDSIEMGNALTLIMEAGLVEWGNGQGIIAMLHKIIDEGLFAEELAQGNNALGAALGVVRVPTVRGQTLAAYDLRVAKGLGFGSIVGPMGGDHTVGGSGPNEDGKYQDPTLSGLARVAAIDGMLCAFLSQPIMMDKEILAAFFQVLTTFFGKPWDMSVLLEHGREIVGLETRFNDLSEALVATIPSMFTDEPSQISKGCFDIPKDEVEHTMAAIRGWFPA